MDPLEKLREAWLKAATEIPDPAPEFVVTLDSGFLLSGATRWPRPRFPRGKVDDIFAEGGVYSGLGLAWLLLQHQARLTILDRRAIGPINRQAAALDFAGLKEGVPPTWSPRFNSMFRPQRIAGCMGWGSLAMWNHNKLPLNSFMIKDTGDLYQVGVDPKTLDFRKRHDFARFFRYPAACQAGEMLALEEWIEPRAKDTARMRIVLFNSTTGEEVFDHGFVTVTDVVKYGPISWPVQHLDYIDPKPAEAPISIPPEGHSQDG